MAKGKQAWIACLQSSAISANARLEAIQRWLARSFKTSQERVLQIEVAGLLGLGTLMIQLTEWAAAIVCWFLVTSLLLIKSLAWEGWVDKPKRTISVRVLWFLASLAFGVLLIIWTNFKKPDDQPWTAFQNWSIFHHNKGELPLRNTQSPQPGSQQDVKQKEYLQHSTTTSSAHPSPPGVPRQKRQSTTSHADLQPQTTTANGSPSTTIIETGPSYGNLGDRALALSNEIMKDVCMFGAGSAWLQANDCSSRETQFQMDPSGLSFALRARYLPRIVDIRNEFYQLHMQDRELDDAIGTAQSNYVANSFAPKAFVDVSKRLKVLAREAIPRERPQPIPFSTARMQAPTLPLNNYDTVVTITPNVLLSRGYIVVEFRSNVGTVSTDIKSSRSVWSNDVDGNQKLKDYLSAYLTTGIRLYALKLEAPLLPNQPVHVFVGGSLDKTPIEVERVTWFDE